MLVLWLIALYRTADAYEYRQMTYDEMKSFLDSLHAYNSDGFRTRQPEYLVTSTAYPDESSTASSSYLEDEYLSSSKSHPHEWSTTESANYPVSQTNFPHEGCKTEEITDEESEYSMQVGSIRGIPGINFPDYTDIPLTSFRCSDKQHIPGFYADMETGCQVFHVCWPHRRESFLCPVGTIFNQAILACDYWYSSNCSLARHYYDVNAASPHINVEYKKEANLGSMIDTLLEPTMQSEDTSVQHHDADLSYILKFLPVKAKVVVYPETTKSRSKIVAEASVGKSKKQKEHRIKKARPTHIIHEAESEYIPVHQKTVILRSQKETATPISLPKIKSKHYRGVINPSVNKIIDQVFDIAKKIVEEAEELVPMFDAVEGVEELKPVHSRKLLPLTKLNQRFIIKPVEVPKLNIINKPKRVQHTSGSMKMSQTLINPRIQTASKVRPILKHASKNVQT